MKFLACFLILAACVFFEQTAAQCRSQPPRTACSGGRDSGVGGRQCVPGKRWFFSPAARLCFSFDYLGCAGNDNRYCSFSDCQSACGRRG